MRKTSAYARRRWQADPLASLRLLDSARPFDEGDTTDQHIKTRAAFERLGNGTADNDDFDRVAMATILRRFGRWKSTAPWLTCSKPGKRP